MHEIEALLAQKESALLQVRRQIEALRRTAALLAEPERQAQPAVPAIVAAVAEQPTTHAEAVAAARGAQAHSAGLPQFVRFSGASVFPPARDGMIVCDGCGHRNPDFL